MGRSGSSVIARHARVAAVAVLLVALLVLALAPAASAARTGRVGPEAKARPGAPLKAIGELALEAWVMYGIWDAQTTGTLTYTMTETAPEMTLAATDATGTPVWSVQAGDIWAATGTLPAAFVAAFTDPDPNKLRDGTLRAYNADGSVRFEKAFTNKFVQPLCITAKRLVWVEVSGRRVTRVYVRQGSKTRSIALPYRPPSASFPYPAASSASGRRLVVGAYMHFTDKWRTKVYWLRVSRTGVPSIVSSKVTDWAYLALSSNGTQAAVISDRIPYATSRCLWVEFGKFGGRLLPGDALAIGEMGVSDTRIFQQGGYSFASETVGWSTYSVAVVECTPMSTWTMYQRAWVWDRETGSIWFRHDPAIVCLAGVDDMGALTVVNADTWNIATVPGTYAEAVPVADGRLALMSATGDLSFIANPVAGP